ncbi:MAG: hypothetical protein V3T17_15930 [Pseudomonadales bacterium]
MSWIVLLISDVSTLEYIQLSQLAVTSAIAGFILLLISLKDFVSEKKSNIFIETFFMTMICLIASGSIITFIYDDKVASILILENYFLMALFPHVFISIKLKDVIDKKDNEANSLSTH